MSFGDAVATGFQKYVVFGGRARRSEFWWFYLAVQLISLPLFVTGGIVMGQAFAPIAEQTLPDGTLPDDVQGDVTWWLFYLGIAIIIMVALVTFFPLLAAMARRLHDAGFSAHWLWFIVVGLVVVPLAICVFPGKPGENRYGPDPRLG
ncbi:DUF805 domain-containing protein [Demequina sp. B12]|uniref:DUF805 domain-containing protein n=1 Tax=Demequina sp. B12 TaxID=2992757 RepID=UPI00237C03B6|nr:DUF805 domain-containing protein [Demequina sp. B12]MDE0572146.1 DUF805 domain-containing protein [Demequina sp. B12]